MTKKLLSIAALGAILATTSVYAQTPPQMKMTTPVPAGVATPDLLETSIGTLTSFDGVPDAKTTQLVYDKLDLDRAIQAFLSTIQISSMPKFKSEVQFLS